jgi:hypothetical protein
MLSTTRTILRASLLSAVVGVCSLGASAQANPLFPTMLQQQLMLQCAPDCIICHLTDAGGINTLRDKSIGKSWKSNFGLDGNAVSSLAPAIMGAQQSMNDADGDGMPDITELQMNENPSDPTNAAALCPMGGTTTPTSPTYGCVHVAPRGHVDDVAAAAGAIVALLGIAALRRRSPRGQPGR